jgi:ATP-dependent Clp protease ATP-binding subunit ClpC
MKDILARAARLTGNGRKKPDTGHVLLALSSAKELASTLLKERGAATAKIKQQLSRLPEEPEGAIEAVLNRAHQIGAQCQSPRLSSLHLLASMAVRDAGRAAMVLEALGVDIAELQTQALRRITGLDRGGSGQGNAKEQLALEPLIRPLALAPRGAVQEKEPPLQLSTRATRPASPQQPILAGRFLEVGRSLESVQRRTRAMRTPANGASEQTEFESHKTPLALALEHPSMATLEIDAQKAPLLARHGRNLTKLAAQGMLPTVVPRYEDLENILDVLAKHRQNCPCLVGPVGVGKTALITGLAYALAGGQYAPRTGRALVELSPSDLLQACGKKGGAQERTAALRKELIEQRGRVLLVLDDVDLFYSGPEVAEVFVELRSALSRGDMSALLAANEREFRRYVEPDSVLSRSLVPIEIGEPSEEVSLSILAAAAPSYEAHHGVSFDDQALQCAVRLSSRYVAGGSMPDKALSCLDLAAGRAVRLGRKEVGAVDIAEVLSANLGVPAQRLAASDSAQLLRLEELLGERIIGHGEALQAIGETLRRNAAGFRGKRPIGSFLLLGPTGVGKTETAKALAELLFPGPGAFIRLDMSEFGEAHTVARLVGSPPGYIGHEEGGQLTEAVRKRPYSLILLDEIEKAHRDVLQLLLQVLDDGRLTDGRGRTVRFDNTIIIMTSNLGYSAGASKRSMGFGFRGGNREQSLVAQAVLDAAKAALPIELWNRIDEPLAFESLTQNDVLRIAALLVRQVSEQLQAEHGIFLAVEDTALEVLVSAGGYDPTLGARPMRRAVQRLIEAPLAKMVLAKTVCRGGRVTLRGQDAKLSMTWE